jgi:transcription elongation GreA/GreB family factor
MLKQKVYEHYRRLIESKLADQQRALQDLIDSAANETKSTAGDKYETGRAMLHIEQDNIRRQMAEVKAQKAVLDTMDPQVHRERIGLGSLVKTNAGYYFLSIATSKVVLEGHTVIALSPQSPLGVKLTGAAPGDKVVMNGKEIVIEEFL